jgi:1,4-alpha-glucan branching enzyme
MGNEFGQTSEWNYKSELDWHLLQHKPHEGLQLCVRELNRILKANPAMYENQFNTKGFQWIDLNHRDDCVIAYSRKGLQEEDNLLIILNLTPLPRMNWPIVIEGKEFTKEIFNSDDTKYWGLGDIKNSSITLEKITGNINGYKMIVNLPPLSALIFK